MAGTTRNLTLMFLPQRWDGANLIANLLLLPNGDPTAPVSLGMLGNELPFSQAQPVLRAAVLPGLATPPWAPAVTPAFVPVHLTYSAAEQSIFAALSAEYTPTLPVLKAVDVAGVIRKDLPDSFMEATGFANPNPDLFTAVDGFGCAIGAQTPSTTQVTPRNIAWGEILSYALRQPLICQAMGLAYLQVSIPLTHAQVSAGGWIWLEIDTTSTENWYAKLVTSKSASVVTYAARLPALTKAQDVFAAILFPTVPGAFDAQVMDTAQFEADLYLDGFAKVVHASQPTTSDSVTGDTTTIVPGTDAGIQIGWDDIQVTTWINRQIQISQALAAGAATQELPFTVLGYRVDVRESPADPWASLCAASGTLNAVNVFNTSFTAKDLCVEPTPIRNSGAGQTYWLPRYFAQWRGRTLVVNDKYGFAFSGGQPPAPSPVTDSDFTGTLSESLSGINLLYGNSYQFRTRLTDLTGGGPGPTDDSPSDAGIATVPFRRYVPPKKVVLTLADPDESGNQSLTVDRPFINYPEMVFTGAADQSTLDALYALIPPQPPVRQFPPPDGSNMPPVPPFQAAVRDSDAVSLEIIVEAEAPSFDTGTPAIMSDANTPPSPGQLDGVFRVVYNWQIDFPALSTPVPVGASTPIQLTLQPTPMSHIDTLVLPTVAQPTVLPIPTGRNIRLRLRAIGADDPDKLYYGNEAARTGLVADIRLRYEAPSEANVLAAGSPDQQLQAFYLRDLDNSAQQSIISQAALDAIFNAGGTFTNLAAQNLRAAINPPAQTPLQLLATAINLPLTGQTISAPPGRRILFGAQSTLRHTLPQDRSTITFSTQKDLINQWVVVHHLTLDRDWTWSGLAQHGPNQLAFTFQGVTYAAGAPLPPALNDLGIIDLPFVVSSLATQQSGQPPSRDTTELIFFSTIDSTVGTDGYPSPSEGFYQLLATFTGSPATPVQLWSGQIEVPITVNPRQTPQLVSAGIAESDYQPSSDYSSTSVRQRSLWFEFDQPPQDKNDAYFVRVINYGPDPLLTSFPSDLTPVPDAPISLDPEPIRTITPDSANDDAGLTAMTELQPSGSSKLHFLVPLPSTISPEALDLFGFWTYEIRVGHLLWSTAQGRFGRPFRVAGVQHPGRHLIANVERITTIPTNGGPARPCILAASSLAQTVLNGVSLTLPTRPQTQVWFLLYAQLRRADGKAYRNLLLTKLQGQVPIIHGITVVAPPAQVQTIPVSSAFSQAQINTILTGLLLPLNTPLSIVAVELFNLEFDVIFDPAKQLAPRLNAPATSNLETATATAVDTAAAPAQDQFIPDPLGNQLGTQRILRVSPLTPVSPIC